MLFDGKPRKSILASLRRQGASPGEILFLSRDTDVKDAADCAWSLQVLLMAPHALRRVAKIMEKTQSDELALRAAKEILAHARQVARQEIERTRTDPRRKDARPPLPVTEGSGLKEVVMKAHQVAQKGMSSSSGGGEYDGGGEDGGADAGGGADSAGASGSENDPPQSS